MALGKDVNLIRPERAKQVALRLQGNFRLRRVRMLCSYAHGRRSKAGAGGRGAARCAGAIPRR
jgi:hypothetical protein